MKPELKEKMEEQVSKAKEFFKKVEEKRKVWAKTLEGMGNFDLNIGDNIPDGTVDENDEEEIKGHEDDWLSNLGDSI